MKKLLNNIVENDYFYAIISRGTCIILGVAYTALFARYFGPSLKGQSAIIINYASIFDTLFSIGIYHAYPFYKKNNSNILDNYINNSMSLYFLYQLFAIAIAMIIPVDIELKIALILFPILSGTRFVNYAILVENPQKRNTTYLFQNIVNILIVCSLFFINRSIKILYFFIVFKEIVTFAISLKSVDFKISKFHFTLNEIPIYMKYGYVSMIAGILVTLNYKIDILMLKPYVSLSDIGIYSIGVNFAEKLWLLPDIIKNILISHLSKGKGEEEVAKVIRISTSIVLISMILVALLGKPLIIILFGGTYKEAYWISMILLFGIIGMMYQRMIYSYNIVNGNRFVNVLYLLIAVIANIIMNLLCIPKWGIVAAALSSVVSYNICGFLFLMYFKKKSGICLRNIILLKKEDLVFLKKIKTKFTR